MSEDGSLKLPSEQPTDDQLVSMSEDREDGILMPHEYTFRRAALDTIKQNPIFTIILLVIGIAQVALSAFSDPGDIIGASDLMMMGAFWATVYGVILGYAGLRTMSEERERREVALMERAVALDDDPDKENTLPFEFLPFTTRVRLSVTPVLRKNRAPIGAGVAIILATSVFMAVVGSPQDGFGCVLAGLLIYALAAGPLLLKEIVRPSKDIQRSINAKQNIRRLATRPERANMKGSLSLDTRDEEDRAGGLTMSQEKGAISAAEPDKLE